MKQKLDWNDKKIKKQIHRLLRAGIQLMFFIVFPSIFTAAFRSTLSCSTDRTDRAA